MRRLITAFVLSALAAVPAAPADAAAWSKPTLLEPPPPSFGFDGVQLAANARGDAVAVWTRSREYADHVTCCEDHRVVASYRPAGGGWSKPEAISRLGDEATGPDVAIDSAGNVLVAWSVDELVANEHPTLGGVGAAFRRTGTPRFDPPQRISDTVGEPVRVVAGAPGEAVVAWEEQEPYDALPGLHHPVRVMAAVQSGPAALSEPVRVSADNAAIVSGGSLAFPMSMELTAAAGGNGTTTLAWLRADGASGTCCVAIEATRREAGGAFGPPVEASSSEEADQIHFPAIASRATGTLITWGHGSSASFKCCENVVARDWPSAGELGPPAESGLTGFGWVAALGSLDDGSARALEYTLNENANFEATLRATSRSAGGAFERAQALAVPAGSADLLVDPDGSAHAIWDRYTGESCNRYECRPTTPRVFAADAPAKGPFGAPRRITGPRSVGSGVSIVAAGGGALASWSGRRGPFVAGLGAPTGAAAVTKPQPGPALSRFRRRGARAFTFRVSRHATVLLDISGSYQTHDTVGEVTVAARRGAGKVVIPEALADRLEPGHRYVASLIATDAYGHDSQPVKEILFEPGAPATR